jgi:hypothetical protein
MRKALKKLGVDGVYFNIIQAIYDKPTASIILWGKTETISFIVRNEIKLSILSTVIQYSFGMPSQNNEQVEEIKGIKMEKEEVKLSLFDDMLLYLKDPKNSTKKLLDIINTFSKVAGYKVNLKKSVAFQCISNERTDSRRLSYLQ